MKPGNKLAPFLNDLILKKLAFELSPLIDPLRQKGPGNENRLFVLICISPLQPRIVTVDTDDDIILRFHKSAPLLKPRSPCSQMNAYMTYNTIFTAQ